MYFLRRLCPTRELLALAAGTGLFLLALDLLFLYGVFPAVRGGLTVKNMTFDGTKWVMPDGDTSADAELLPPAVAWLVRPPDESYHEFELPADQPGVPPEFFELLSLPGQVKVPPRGEAPFIPFPARIVRTDPVVVYYRPEDEDEKAARRRRPPYGARSEHVVTVRYFRRGLRTPVFGFPLPDQTAVIKIRCVQRMRYEYKPLPPAEAIQVPMYALLLQHATSGPDNQPVAVGLLSAARRDVTPEAAFDLYSRVVALRDPPRGVSRFEYRRDQASLAGLAPLPQPFRLLPADGKLPTDVKERAELVRCHPRLAFALWLRGTGTFSNLKQAFLTLDGYERGLRDIQSKANASYAATYGYGDVALGAMEILDIVRENHDRFTAGEWRQVGAVTAEVSDKLLARMVRTLLAARVPVGDGCGYRYLTNRGQWDSSVTQVIEYVLSRFYFANFLSGPQSWPEELRVTGLTDAERRDLEAAILGCRKTLSRCRSGADTATGDGLRYGDGSPGSNTLIGGYYAAMAGAFELPGGDPLAAEMRAAQARLVGPFGVQMANQIANPPKGGGPLLYTFYNQLFVGRAAQRIVAKFKANSPDVPDPKAFSGFVRLLIQRNVDLAARPGGLKESTAGSAVNANMYHCTLAMFYEAMQHVAEQERNRR